MPRNRLQVFVWIAPLLLVAPVVLTGGAYFFGTTILQFHPWRVLALNMLRAGELPLWNPLSGMGAPLLANYQSALLYPPTWLLFLLGWLGGESWMAWGQGVLVFLHIVLASWGMVRLVRALGLPAFSQALGGLAFGLSGYLVARAHFLSINATVAWLPWVLLGAYRLAKGSSRVAALQLSAWTGLMLLAGHAQTAWYTLLLAGGWFIFWLLQPDSAAHSQDVSEIDPGDATDRADQVSGSNRLVSLGWFLGALLLGGMVAAVQLLPTAELLRQSQRAGGAGEAFVMTYSLWPWRLLGLFFPGLFGSPVTGDYWGYANFWEDAFYIGLLPVLLALRAVFTRGREGTRRALVIFLTGVTLISFLLALGDNTPVFPYLYRHILTFNLFQAPTRFSLWAVFSLALLAAIGAQEWAASVSSYSRQRAGRWTAVGLAMLLAGVVTILFLPQITASFGRSVLIAGTIATASSALGIARARGIRWQALALSLVSVDLLVAGWGLNPGIDLAIYAPRPAVTSALAENLGSGRLYLFASDEYSLTFDRFFRFDTFLSDRSDLRTSLLPNLNLLQGVHSANNFDPLQISRYVGWIEILETAEPDLQGWMLAEMGVSMIEDVTQESGELAFIAAPARPRVEWLPCARPATDQQAAQARRLTRDPGDANFVILEGFDTQAEWVCGGPVGPEASGTALLKTAGFNTLTVHTNADVSGWLLVRDTYFPGWQAAVDGEAVEIYPANGLFRALPVPSGAHEVKLNYSPGSFATGLGFSPAALAGGVVLWLRLRKEAV